MKRALLEAVLAARAARMPVGLVTRLADGAQALVTPDAVIGELAVDAAAVRALVAADRSGRQEDGTFVQAISPAPRLFVVGAVHIAQALVPMAGILGYAVTVIDPRRAFATDSRFPEVALRHDWPDEAMAVLKPDARTAVVTLTHDPKIDDPALVAALRSPAFYIGALGSRRTHGRRLDRLRAEGFDEAALARIHGPVGLDIAAVSPAEIATAILAQITAVRRAGR
ncbi:MAG: hypothetical protein OHK0024_17360 [Thalassobaculales bacterium]